MYQTCIKMILWEKTLKKYEIAEKRRNATKNHCFCYALSDPRPGVPRPTADGHQKRQAPNYGRISRFGAIFGIYVKRKKC